MKRVLMLTLGAALSASACGTTASDSVGPPDSKDGVAAAPAPGTAESARPRGTAPGATARTAPRPVEPRERSVRELTLPAGTTLSLGLTTAVASDTSRVEDAIGARFTAPVDIDGRQVVPAGAQVAGIVTAADESARVKGRALVTVQFTSIQTGGSRYDMRTEPVSWLAPATKGQDAVKIGAGAGAGAAIGGLLGGKTGAARGAAVGGAAGTGVVLATRGEEVRLTVGTDATTRLTSPLTIRLSPSN